MPRIKNVTIGNEFTVSKTHLRFVEVTFSYEKEKWLGCFPLHYPPKGIDFDLSDIDILLHVSYEQLSPKNIEQTRGAVAESWPTKTGSETHKVFESLLSGNWECRSCGSGKINDQPAARIRDIKKWGYVVATKTRHCESCGKLTYQDQLLLFDIETETRPELRKPLSLKLKARIIQLLGNEDAFFGQIRSSKEFVVDHKFPSQRWTEPETDNGSLDDESLKRKFQLLNNQTNMLKSRMCDRCVATGRRPGFLGIEWFYKGGPSWAGNPKDPESGCIGCPWYDLKKWKSRLNEQLDG